MGNAWRSLSCLLLALSVSVTIGGAAAAPSKRERASERLAYRLFFKADRQVQRERACLTLTPQRRPSFDDGAPSEELLSTVGVLRRAQSEEEERLSSGEAPLFGLGDGVHRRYVRAATSASGRRFVIFAARDAQPTRPRPERCRAELRRRFARLLRGREARFRRFALRIGRRLLRDERRRQARGPQEGVFLFDRSLFEGRAGGGTGGAGAREIRRSGIFQASSNGRSAKRSRVDGLLPDGVATVKATFPRVGSTLPGRGRKRRRYDRVVRVTVPVQDNVVSFTVPRAVEDALAVRIVWRAADGRVIRVVRLGSLTALRVGRSTVPAGPSAIGRGSN